MIRRTLLVLLGAFVLACSPARRVVEDSSPDIDGGTTSTVDGGSTQESPDAGSPSPDAGSVTSPDAGSATTSPDAGSTNTTADAGSTTSPPVTSVAGQCARTTDCPTGLSCATSAPGGICNGCVDDSDCEGSDGRTYTCRFGGCNLDCGSDQECPTGMRCLSGACALRPCSMGCAAPYVCDNGYCRRPPCDSACPADKCVSGVCTADR